MSMTRSRKGFPFRVPGFGTGNPEPTNRRTDLWCREQRFASMLVVGTPTTTSTEAVASVGPEVCSKAQISLEMLVTLGMVLAFTVPIVLLLFSLSQAGLEKTALIQAEASAKTLADAINEVYAEGTNAKRTVFLNLPVSTQSLEVSGNEVTVTVATTTGDYEAASPIFARARTEPADGLPVRGVTVLVVESYDDGVRVYGAA